MREVGNTHGSRSIFSKILDKVENAIGVVHPLQNVIMSPSVHFEERQEGPRPSIRDTCAPVNDGALTWKLWDDT